MAYQGSSDDGVEYHDMYIEHKPVDLYCPPEEGMTRQEFANDCDINLILDRYQTTGVMDHFNLREPLYLDVSNVPDLAGALQLLDVAQQAFMRLDAKVRREFENDPVKFVAFAENPANVEKMREWGLAAPQTVAGALKGSGGTVPAPPVENAPAAISQPPKT